MDRHDIKEQGHPLTTKISPCMRDSVRPSNVDDSELKEVFNDLASDGEALCSTPLHYSLPLKADEEDHSHIVEELASYTKHRHEDRSSVSFHSHVNLDDDMHRPRRKPLPNRKSRIRGRSLLEQLAISDAAPSRGECKRDIQNPIAGEFSKERHSHWPEPQHDLGDPQVSAPKKAGDGQWTDKNVESKVGCRPSELIISSEYSFREKDQHPGYSTTSPRALSTPIAFPHMSGSESQTDLQRSYLLPNLNGVRINNARRSSRRSTGQSSSSSLMSPASAFLSSFNHANDQDLTNPNDEGQEIGDERKYILGQQIGVGGFNIIREAHSIEGGKTTTYAVKIMRKQLAKNTQHDDSVMQMRIEHEVSIWRKLQHRHVVPLIDFYDNSFAKFCVMTRVAGTLHDLVRSHRRESFTAIRSPAHNLTSMGSNLLQRPGTNIIHLHLARRYIYQIAAALHYLHREMHIVHRDIKLENCLLDTSASSQGNILLCDFGLANFINCADRDGSEGKVAQDDNEDNPIMKGKAGKQKCAQAISHSTTITGSLPYASPELLNGDPDTLYEPSSDVWAFGVVCHALLKGELPFTGVLMPMLMKSILQGDWNKKGLEDAVRGETDEVERAMELVTACLRIDQTQRWNVADVLSCVFLEGGEVSCDDGKESCNSNNK